MTNVRQQDRLHLLDGLRFMAAICVVIYHFTYQPSFLGAEHAHDFAWLQTISKFGYLGVELFFLISGFVILWSASGRSPASYVASRVSRVLPSLWVSVAITCGALLLFHRDVYLVDLKAIAGSMTLVGSYLGLPYVDGVYWTLQIEIKFYILIFLLIVARQISHLQQWLAVWVCGLVISYSPYGPGWLKSLVLFPYGSYFVGGSLFFLMWRYGITHTRIGLMLISLVLSLLCVRQEGPAFMGNDTSVQAIAVASFIVVLQYILFMMLAIRTIRVAESKWWVIFGSITYPLYLLHNQVGKAIAASVVPVVGSVGAVVIAFAITFLLAVLLSRTVEKSACPWLRGVLLGGARRFGLVAS